MMRMKTKKIKIYNTNWTIKWVNDEEMRTLHQKYHDEVQPSNMLTFGLCVAESNIININTICSYDRQRITLIHELGHAIFFESGFKSIDNISEETLVDFISHHYDEITKILKKVYK